MFRVLDQRTLLTVDINEIVQRDGLDLRDGFEPRRAAAEHGGAGMGPVDHTTPFLPANVRRRRYRTTLYPIAALPKNAIKFYDIICQQPIREGT